MSISIGPGIGFAIQNGDGNNGSLVQAEGAYGWNGTGWDRFRANKVHKYQEYINFTNTQTLEIWTPASTKKFRLMSVLIGSNYTTGAKFTLREVQAGSTTVFNNIATFNFTNKDTIAFDFGPNGYLSSTADYRLAVYNDSGATASLWTTFIGTEE